MGGVREDVYGFPRNSSVVVRGNEKPWRPDLFMSLFDPTGQGEHAFDGSPIEVNHGCLTDPKCCSADGGSGASDGLWRQIGLMFRLPGQGLMVSGASAVEGATSQLFMELGRCFQRRLPKVNSGFSLRAVGGGTNNHIPKGRISIDLITS